MFSYKKKYNSTPLTADDIYRKAVESGRFIMSNSNKLIIKNQQLKSHDANKGKIISNLFKGVYVPIYIHNEEKNIIADFFFTKAIFYINYLSSNYTVYIYDIWIQTVFSFYSFFILTFFWGVLRTVKSIEKIIHNKR